MQKKQSYSSAGGGLRPPATFQGFPPLTGGSFSRTLPVYVGARANIWGMDVIHKDKFKKEPEKEQPPQPLPEIVVPQVINASSHKPGTLKKEPRMRILSVAKRLSPAELQKLEKKMSKLAAFADEDFKPADASAPAPMRGQLSMSADSFHLNSSGESSSDDETAINNQRTTNETGRRSSTRVFRPPSPSDDDECSLGNSVTPLKAAPRRNAKLVVSKQVRDLENNLKYIPNKVNLPKQMSHLFRSDAAAITEVAAAEISEMSYLEIPDWNKYFGEEARLSFLSHYESACRDLNKAVDGHKNFTKQRNSPRTRYLREVALKRLPPLSLLMRKTDDPNGLNISHKGIGDHKMIPLVNIIEKLPSLNAMILADNRLTDLSLTPLMLKLPSLPMLMHLDLSYNKIDKCSEYLMTYLRNDSCRLQILVLDGADVDDVECTHIAEALMDNDSVLSLSLKNNKIGTAELQNVATPNFVTGGEGLGRMLLKNKTMLELDISWNYIRLDSACAIAESLIVNSTLRVLKVAHNGFGDLGTQIMGIAIKQNTRLQVLDMSYNQITPKAAAVLQNGLVHNEKINTLVLDGNILGQIGARALVSAIQRASGEGRILRISFVNCDCEKESRGLFDASAPGGTYELDLSEPYGQMVAEECIYLLNYRVGCELLKMDYTPKMTMPWKSVPLERQKMYHKTENAPGYMKQFCATFLDLEEDEATLRAMNNLLTCFELFPAYRLTRKIVEVIRDLYHERELLAISTYQKNQLLPTFEHELLLETFKALYRIADDDCSGEMCIEEFYNCLDSLGVGFDPKYSRRLFVEFDKDNSGNIDEEEFGMIMVNEFCRPDTTRGELVERQTRAPWPIPASGFVRICIDYQCEQAALSDISHDEGISNVIAAIRDSKTEAERMVLFDQAISSPYYYMSAQQALMLYEEVSKHVVGEIDVISRMIPQIVNSEQRVRFLDTLLDGNGKISLRVKMGQMYNCLLGLPTGHYTFDLKEKQDRNLGRALATIWGTEVKYSKSIGCNTSQKGNYSNFRNEIIGVNHVTGLDSTWFSRCPHTGRLSLDYVSTARPRMGITPLTDNRFSALMSQLGLGIIKEYMNDPKRLERESYLEMGIPPAVHIVHIKEVYYAFSASTHHSIDIYPVEACRDMSRTDYDPDARPVTPDILKYAEFDDSFPPIYPLAYYKMLQLQLVLPTVWMSGEQAKKIIRCFPADGYIRVQVYMSIFSRIVEFDKFTAEIISDIFSEDEQNEIFHRLGVLNVIDPLFSDRFYKMDLRRWDHRELCRAVVKLAIDQPGENLKYCEYRWSKYDSAVPGWWLPMNWVTSDEENGGDGGPRKFGWCCLDYFSSGLNIPSVKRACYHLRKNFHAGAVRPVLN